jgi:hypothetical protein
MREPFALGLFRRFLNGETVECLSAELEIPPDRIEMRLRAAELYLKAGQEKIECSTPDLRPVAEPAVPIHGMTQV